ncbi:MAG: HD domain-containing protein [Tumebacillaceae bacterium]
MDMERLAKQFAFIVEIDKVKSIYRRSFLIDRTRNENDAEHSWHLAMMALVLYEHANDKTIDLLRVLKMVLIHDIVEIDAGDTSPYDKVGLEDKHDREIAAANRIFGLLPDDQRAEMYEIWQEFEEKTTSESKFAHAIDRLAPLLLNYHTEGATWKNHGVTLDMVLALNSQIGHGAESLWEFAQDFIRDAVEKGYLPEQAPQK